jgi:hypothetical protein
VKGNEDKHMNMRNTILWILACLVLVMALGSCGGGEDPVTTPTDPPIGGPGDGGDIPDPTIPGQPLNPFLPPGGVPYTDIRGIASSREFVYIGDAATLYCFDKRGNLRNAVAAPDTIQGVSVFPATVAEEVTAPGGYLLANAPVIVHDPVQLYGYITVYAPGLDPSVTREDQPAPDALRVLALPWGDNMIPPLQDAGWLCLRTYDIKVDRYGSILCLMDLEAVPQQLPIPDLPRTLQMFSRFNLDALGRGYYIQNGGIWNFLDENNDPATKETPGNHRRPADQPDVIDAPLGDFDYEAPQLPDITPFDWVNLGEIAVDTLSPPRLGIDETGYNLALTAANFQRDYVGLVRTSVTTEGVQAPAVAAYEFEATTPDEWGYRFIIGDLPGTGPSSFSPNPAPGGDPDLTQGGPSGMCFDPRPDHNNELYVCDPGNSRVTIFRSTGEAGPWHFMDVITQDSSGRDLIAPSSVTVDPDGNVFIGDINTVRRFIRKPINDTFGAVGGTVTNATINVPLVGATVTVRSQDGFTVAETKVTDINGQYLFENLPVGNYFMQASKFNYHSDTPTTPLTVLADERIIVNFNLFSPTPENFGNYVGNIRDTDSHKPIQGVRVQILGTGLSTTTDTTGHFEIPNIPPGSYQVLFSTEDNTYEAFVRDVVITTGQTVVDNFLEMDSI